MKAIGKITVKATSSIVNNIILTAIVLLIAFAGYALWDSNQLHYSADKLHYAVYKPTAADEGKSFKELQAINEEVFAWLTVYGTNIDYPVTQGSDNMKYVNTNAEGNYSLSGAIFLDSGNSKDFSDFNSILYGHHMAKKVMFGEIGEFSDKDMFDSHRYGNLYYNDKNHGIEFFAFLHTDAYDSMIFRVSTREDDHQAYLDDLLSKSIYIRDIGITIQDRIVLLSTCSSDSTNGRDILVGRISDNTFDDPANATEDIDINQGVANRDCLVKEIPLWAILLILTLTTLLIMRIIKLLNSNEKKKGGRGK